MQGSKPKGLTSLVMLLSMTATSTTIFASESAVLETLTTIGTRTERALNELDASVSVKTSDQLEEELARNIEDLVRFEPGVSVGGTGSRFGAEGISIRGIGGNRVLTIIDGVRVAEEFSFGPFLSARRDFVDLDSLARTDIARGPISPLYGSDALGGVVSFTSKKPLDYLQDGESIHAGLKTGYSSDDDGTVATLTLVSGDDVLSGLLLYTRRDGNETETQGSVGGTGSSRELADPQDISSDSLTARMVYRPSDFSEFSLSASLYSNDTDTQVLSDYDSFSRGVLTTSRDTEDQRQRSGLTLAYKYEGKTLLSDALDARVYYQTSETEQLTTDGRLSRGVPQIRTRFSQFEQDIFGAQLNLSKAFTLSSTTHQLSYGLDYYETDNASQRNGGTVNALTAEAVFEFFPFPTRDFPLTKVAQTAVYLQNEISMLDDRLRVTPGIRYDSFSADTTADDVYLTGNPGSPLPEDYQDSEVTAKLGIVYQLTPEMSLYTRYSEGFRAPPYDDVNVGFTNAAGGYKTISNPALSSETSRGYELGMRFQNEAGHLVIAAFKNDYEDFIEAQKLAPAFLFNGGVDPVDNLTVFQAVNLGAVEIAGVELSGSVNLGELSQGLDGLNLRAAIAYADGEDTGASQPLNAVEPCTGVFGLSYKNPSERWGGNLYLTLVGAKDLDDIHSDDPRTPVGGYGLIDLMAHYQITDKIRVDAGIFNLTDKSYVRWTDTASINADAVDRFSQPGINTRLTLRVEL